LAVDEKLHKQGIGLELNLLADLLIPTSKPAKKMPLEPGMTDDDIGLLRLAAESTLKELQEASVRMRPTAAVKHRVAEELVARGIELATDERREVELEVLKAELKAWSDIRKRLEGELIPTPNVDDRTAAACMLAMAFTVSAISLHCRMVRVTTRMPTLRLSASLRLRMFALTLLVAQSTLVPVELCANRRAT
jgi:hypothetical protein